VAVGNN